MIYLNCLRRLLRHKKQRLLNETNGNEEQMLNIMNHPSEINIDTINDYDYLINNDYNDDVIQQLKNIF